MLLTLKSEIDPESGDPLDVLTEECIGTLQEIGSSSTSVPDVIREVRNLPHGLLAAAIQSAFNQLVCLFFLFIIPLPE